MSLAAKSTVLRYEQERTVHAVRIFTDARPIFGPGAESPEAAIILYNLKIAFHHAGRGIEEIFFSLDENDLQQLKKAIQRAELKAASLGSVLAKAKVKVFNLE
jgi:hypothetical protein